MLQLLFADPVRLVGIGLIAFVLWQSRAAIAAWVASFKPLPVVVGSDLAKSSTLLSQLAEIALANGDQQLASDLTVLWQRFLKK